MGYSIDFETHEKLERNRAAGRLCVGGHRYCTAKAIWKAFTDFWVTVEDKDAGKAPYRTAATDTGMAFCTKHAKALPVEGGNFTTRRIEKF